MEEEVNDDIDDQVLDDNNNNTEYDDNFDDDADEDLLDIFGPDELQKLEDLIEARQAQLQKSNEKSKQWLDMITRRRMFAFSRIRKLEKSRQDRKHFLSTMAVVVNKAVDLAENSTTQTHSGRNVDDETKSASGTAANGTNESMADSAQTDPASNGAQDGQVPSDTPRIVVENASQQGPESQNSQSEQAINNTAGGEQS